MFPCTCKIANIITGVFLRITYVHDILCPHNWLLNITLLNSFTLDLMIFNEFEQETYLYQLTQSSPKLTIRWFLHPCISKSVNRWKVLHSVNWNISEWPLNAHGMFTEIRISGIVPWFSRSMQSHWMLLNDRHISVAIQIFFFQE